MVEVVVVVVVIEEEVVVVVVVVVGVVAVVVVLVIDINLLLWTVAVVVLGEVDFVEVDVKNVISVALWIVLSSAEPTFLSEFPFK